MARNWTRAQQRKYREERRRQAALVASRLLGKKVCAHCGHSEKDHQVFDGAWTGACGICACSLFLREENLEHDDRIDAAAISMATNLYVARPRHNMVITGFKGE